MKAEFDAIMADVLITTNSFQQDFVALLRLARWVMRHYDVLCRLLDGAAEMHGQPGADE